ncbi:MULTISPECIES: carbonic anhydrase [unclassified Agarivorans]|uniref:carbonic anhydrase n=1 Tax=unclassified Agarivorans TaxID=2636026 RepID=UPI003D7ECD27
MNKASIKLSVLASALLISSTVIAQEGNHWGYTGHQGPEHWAELSPAFATCASGVNQSPIDISDSVEGELAPLSFDYQVAGQQILNNGHAVQVNYAAGSKLSVDGHSFELKQFHFHAPSENTIEGQSFPMEAHFVHADAEGHLAVVAVMFEEGKTNPELAKAWAQLPHKTGEKFKLEQQVSALSLLPEDHDYYRFNGSLTTPPCSEGVVWLVMKQPVSASKQQIEQFVEVLHHPNNRPVQARNARVVIK